MRKRDKNPRNREISGVQSHDIFLGFTIWLRRRDLNHTTFGLSPPAPRRSHGRRTAPINRTRAAPCFAAVASPKTPRRGVFGSLTQRATLVGLITRGHDPQFRFAAKKNGIPTGMPFFLVAEAGFEPHDLRVMSPTSYQAAPLRDRNLSFKGLYRIPREHVFVKYYFQICSVT